VLSNNKAFFLFATFCSWDNLDRCNIPLYFRNLALNVLYVNVTALTGKAYNIVFADALVGLICFPVARPVPTIVVIIPPFFGA
jgi:hypothetical protein